MQRLLLILAGAAVGFIETLVVWIFPNQPHPGMTVAAGTIQGALVALLLAYFVHSASSLRSAIVWGVVIGFTSSCVIFLSKGGWETWDAPFIVPSGVITGGLLGVVVRAIHRKPPT